MEHFCIPKRESSPKPRDYLIDEMSVGKIDKLTLRWYKIQEYLKIHDYIEGRHWAYRVNCVKWSKETAVDSAFFCVAITQ